MRFEVFRKNLELIENHDPVKMRCGLKMNHFMDWTDEEYRRTHGHKSFPKVNKDGKPIVGNNNYDIDLLPDDPKHIKDRVNWVNEILHNERCMKD